MIKARHHFVVYPMFKWLTRILVRGFFRPVLRVPTMPDNGNAVLIIANHVSWWDGFWLEYLNLATIRRKLHFMMLEEQLVKHWYFGLAGGYSVRKGTKEVVESLSYTVNLLKSPGNMVIMFPQGEITSSYDTNIVFEKGVQAVIDQMESEGQVLMVANFTDYFSCFRPGLYAYCRLIRAEEMKGNRAAAAYREFYSDALHDHIKRDE